MTTDQELEAFFETRTQRVAELRAQYQAGWPWSIGGCSIGCLIPFGLMLLFTVQGKEWSETSWFVTALIGAGVVAVASAAVGSRLYARGQKLFAPVDAAVDAELIRPFAALLVDGAALEYPDDSILEWRGGLLFSRSAHLHASQGKTNRIRGHIAGLPAVLDEIFIRLRHGKNAGTFGGWVVRCELPFAVAGHLRIRRTSMGYSSLMWREGFEPLADATARLGTDHEIDAAAPGVTPDGAEAPTSGGVPVEALLTDTLFERLRGAGKAQVAATGRTLWVVVPNVRAFDNRRSIATFDADFGRKTAGKMEIVEGIASEVLRAGGGRS